MDLRLNNWKVDSRCLENRQIGTMPGYSKKKGPL